jgi:transcriptional regulator with XRE-family HTH domain
VNETMSDVIGQNVRRLRTEAGLTLNAVAQQITAVGHRWSHSQVAALERGAVSPTLPTLFIVCAALSALVGREITLGDLVHATAPVALGARIEIDPEALRTAARGGPVDLSTAGGEDVFSSHVIGRAERDYAAQVDMPAEDILAAAVDLFGHSMTAERDARAGADATVQKRGRITRTLRDEIDAELRRRAAAESSDDRARAAHDHSEDRNG